ncbi:pickpocket protein 19-like [Drosophila tropicalis]|uniref:pickpocket protein 19-like n=1 Tax=Drosophila tropicalis TaxID=46794 RepID=UPI0035ABABA2
MSPSDKVSSLNGKNNDDSEGEESKQKEHKCVCIRRYGRTPLKLLAAVATVYVCMLSSERYFAYWVQTTIERTDVHVSEIPFPAITICPLKMTGLNLTTLTTEPTTPESAFETPSPKDIERYPIYKNVIFGNILGFVNYTCKDLFIECQWRRQPVDCCSIFSYMSTVEGTCLAFNSVVAINPNPTWPWSVAGSGSNSGLNVKLNRVLKRKKVESLGAIVHESDQYLGTSVIYSSEDRIVIPVEPLRFTAETDVRARPVQMRRCYFTSELGLIGKSRSRCIVDCHVDYIYKKCNCYTPISNYLHGEYEANDTKELKLCGRKDLACVQKYRVSLFSLSNIIEESNDNVFSTMDCGCFPNCDHIQYHTSTYTEKLSSMEKTSDYIELDVYFQEETLFSYRSMLRFTLLDLTVSFGGIAGLIMGISVLGGLNAFLDRFTCCKLHKKT